MKTEIVVSYETEDGEWHKTSTVVDGAINLRGNKPIRMYDINKKCLEVLINNKVEKYVNYRMDHFGEVD